MFLKALLSDLFSLIFFMNDIFLFGESSNVFDYADDNVLFAFGKNFDLVTRKLQKYFLILNKWFFNNFFKLNSEKCYLMTLRTPTILPNFKLKNITIKNSVSEKLLDVIIDNKLTLRKTLINGFRESVPVCNLHACC